MNYVYVTYPLNPLSQKGDLVTSFRTLFSVGEGDADSRILFGQVAGHMLGTIDRAVLAIWADFWEKLPIKYHFL